MSLLPGAGNLEIRVATARDVICSVDIRSTRPVGLTRIFVGREPQEAPLLARRLFSLCGAAQAAAASEAVAQARGRRLGDGDRFGHAVGVLAERVFEGLRALVLGWPDGEALAALRARAAPRLREAAVAAQTITSAAASGLGHARREELLTAAIRLAEAVEAFGLLREDEAQPEPTSYFGAVARQCEAERAFACPPPDPLTPEDDVEVVAMLREAPEAFVGAPSLPGRVLETGPFALHGRAFGGMAGLGPRFLAQLAAIASASRALEACLRDGESRDAPLDGGEVGPDGGYGAVESARGRLYHWVEINSRGQIGQYRIVAPTEWNFHPRGPFVASALGAKVASGEKARLSLARLAALFDPCVGFEVTLKEFADA